MRFSSDGGRWVRACSLRLRQEVGNRRGEIREVTGRRLSSGVGGDPGSDLLECSLLGHREIHAIVDLAPGAALNSWLEAAPTGLVIGDAD